MSEEIVCKPTFGIVPAADTDKGFTLARGIGWRYKSTGETVFINPEGEKVDHLDILVDIAAGHVDKLFFDKQLTTDEFFAQSLLSDRVYDPDTYKR